MKVTLFWKPLLWLLMICYLLFVPADQIPSKPLFEIPHFDKLVHFVLFMVFSLLLYKPMRFLKSGYPYLAPLFATILAVSLEISQHSLSQTRSSDLKDLLANLAGILFSIVLYRGLFYGKKLEKII